MITPYSLKEDFVRKLAIGIGILAILSLTGCEPPPDRDVIKFTAGGQSIELRLGFEDTESIPLVNISSGTPLAFAANEVTDFTEPEEYCFLYWAGDGTGSFVGEMEYWNNQSGVSLDGNTLTMEITAWEEVGGYCSGTFSGTVNDINDDPVEITDGYFNCKRFPDDTF